MPKEYNSDLQELMYKIKNSVTCSCLFALENNFNKVGLTLQTTTKNRMILCKIKNSRPYCKEFMDDYIFVGSADEDRELSKRAVECIIEFVMNAASDKPAKIKDEQRNWQDGISLYGKVILVNEDVEAVAGNPLMD
ncbi:MAG: hypothetical protein GF411_20575 [Candidatus Lokiarchaeota archaeon]|nr:hypothetical protein [Candidatus Lokiarchaeota archaeon]